MHARVGSGHSNPTQKCEGFRRSQVDCVGCVGSLPQLCTLRSVRGAVLQAAFLFS
jgi:hypothetical protein